MPPERGKRRGSSLLCQGLARSWRGPVLGHRWIGRT